MGDMGDTGGDSACFCTVLVEGRRRRPGRRAAAPVIMLDPWFRVPRDALAPARAHAKAAARAAVVRGQLNAAGPGVFKALVAEQAGGSPYCVRAVELARIPDPDAGREVQLSAGGPPPIRAVVPTPLVERSSTEPRGGFLVGGRIMPCVNRYCVVMIQGFRDGKPAFMLDPYRTMNNPDKDPTALDKTRGSAKLIRELLAAAEPNPFQELVKAQVGVGPYRVEPVILTGIPEPSGDED